MQYIYTLSGVIFFISLLIIPVRVLAMLDPLATFVKQRRRLLRLSQPDLAAKAGVGLRFVRELEQGKGTLRLDKVNAVLQLFGHEVGPVPVLPSPEPE